MDDRAEIENLLARYAHYLDAGEFDRLGSLFENGSVRITGGPHDGRSARGAEGASALYREIVLVDPDSGRTGTRHLVASSSVMVDGSDAISRCYFVVLQQTPRMPLQVVASGVYEDRLKRFESGWAFVERQIVCDQTGDLSQHMA